MRVCDAGLRSEDFWVPGTSTWSSGAQGTHLVHSRGPCPCVRRLFGVWGCVCVVGTACGAAGAEEMVSKGVKPLELPDNVI